MTALRALWARQFRYQLVLHSFELEKPVSVLSRHRWAWSAEAWSYLRPNRCRGIAHSLPFVERAP